MSFENTKLAMAPFNAQRPGIGCDRFHRETVLEHDMATALYASAAIYAGHHANAVTALDRLLARVRERGDGRTGWGLPFEWDAFADGSINSVDTIYGITTALAVRALFDGADLPSGDLYVAAGRAALDTYKAAFERCGDEGYFWYSDQPQDAKCVFNVCAMLAGQYARAHSLKRDPVFEDIALLSLNGLLRREKQGVWPYSADADKPNDCVHAAYILQGLFDISKALSCDVAVNLDHMRGFIRDGMAFEYHESQQPNPPKLNAPARGWGLGMLLHLAADLNDVALQNAATLALVPYVAGEGIFGVLPGEREFLPRHQAHIVFGLARAGL